MRPRSRLKTPTLQSVVHNVYTGPALDYLQHGDGALLGTFRVTDLEIYSGMADGGAFIGVLNARIHSTLEDMAAVMRAPTFPVHDEPAPKGH